MRRLADYTVGLVIVIVHLVMMSRANETLALEVRRGSARDDRLR